MSPTLHKLLIHEADIIKNAVLPIDQLSEEVQEARNKDVKQYKECHSRKFSRTCTIEDIFNFLLISSDPYISSLRRMPKKIKQIFFPGACSKACSKKNKLRCIVHYTVSFSNGLSKISLNLISDKFQINH
jgi:hypothetical protein